MKSIKSNVKMLEKLVEENDFLPFSARFTGNLSTPVTDVNELNHICVVSCPVYKTEKHILHNSYKQISRIY